jgi:hypothetical protein
MRRLRGLISGAVLLDELPPRKRFVFPPRPRRAASEVGIGCPARGAVKRSHALRCSLPRAPIDDGEIRSLCLSLVGRASVGDKKHRRSRPDNFHGRNWNDAGAQTAHPEKGVAVRVLKSPDTAQTPAVCADGLETVAALQPVITDRAAPCALCATPSGIRPFVPTISSPAGNTIRGEIPRSKALTGSGGPGPPLPRVRLQNRLL